MHYIKTHSILGLIIFVLFGGGGTIPMAHATIGICSYYSLDGLRTSSGEIFSSYHMTAAHRSYPNGTLVRVTNLDNKRSVIVRINDYGPVDPRRSIDLSWRAFGKIASHKKGLLRVKITKVGMKQKS